MTPLHRVHSSRMGSHTTHKLSCHCDGFSGSEGSHAKGSIMAICLLASEYGFLQSPEETQPTKSDVKDLRDWNPNLTMVFIREAFGDC